MSKEEKLKEKIEFLESSLKLSLQKKSGKAIDIAKSMTIIQGLKLELLKIKKLP